MNVLLVDADAALPGDVAELLAGEGWHVASTRGYSAAHDAVRTAGLDAIVVSAAHNGGANADALRALVRAADAHRVATLVVGDCGVGISSESVSLLDVVGGNATKEEIRGRLSTVGRYQGLVRRMERELQNLHRLGKHLNRHFTEVDEELRLAARLQRDFLPGKIEPIGRASFATLYRPATWVSGDLYDIFRVDERHVGFYVVDVVGHGLAASLLTMFIKRAITPKHIAGDQYEVLDPATTLAILNDALASQHLPNCQFATGCYCLLNTETLELRYARAGHPYPLLCSADGGVNALKSSGGLLGLFDNEEFPSQTVRLSPGDRVLLYTDGLEPILQPGDDGSGIAEEFRKLVGDPAAASAEDIVQHIENALDGQFGSLNPRDDVTAVVLELLPG